MIPVMEYLAPSGLMRSEYIRLNTGLHPVLVYPALSGLIGNSYVGCLHRASPCADTCRPFRAYEENYIGLNTGLHPVLMYVALSGLMGMTTRVFKHRASPGVDVCRPFAVNGNKLSRRRHRASPCGDICRPFRAYEENYIGLNTGLHPVLMYVAPSGLNGYNISCLTQGFTLC